MVTLLLDGAISVAQPGLNYNRLAKGEIADLKSCKNLRKLGWCYI